MPIAPESQKTGTTRARFDAPDMAKLKARSTLTGGNRTCAICGVAYPDALFQQHVAEAHGARNKEPLH
jgi:hypothetical protein